MVENSTIRWIRAIQSGDAEATEALWEEFFGELVTFARRKLARTPTSLADEEDVALSAIKSFCLRAANGGYPNLKDRDELWRLLLTITACKAVSLNRYQTRLKRGGAHARHQTTVAAESGSSYLDQVAANDAGPDVVAMFSDELDHTLNALEPLEREIVVLKLQGHTNSEIADQTSHALRTIERKLHIIRRRWQAQPD